MRACVCKCVCMCVCMHAACIAERMLSDGLMVRVRVPCIRMCVFRAYVRACVRVWVGGCIAERVLCTEPLFDDTCPVLV